MAPPFWAEQSPVTAPGDNPTITVAIDALPNDLAALRNATSQHVFHFLNSNYADKGVPPERRSEINLRYASAILESLLSRGDTANPSLAAARPPGDRVVGCARDSVVTFLTLARAKGIPARGRVGFTSMFCDEDSEGWWIDHVVAEVWDAGESRWRMVETRMAGRDDGKDEDGKFELLDLKEEDFLTAPKAWKAVREGKLDPTKFGVDADDNLPPFLKGWHYLAHNMLHDLAWLDKKEMLLWDHWGVQDGMSQKAADVVREELTGLLDEISAVTVNTEVEPAAVKALAQRDGLRVPKVIGSVDGGGGMIEVDVSRVIGE